MNLILPPCDSTIPAGQFLSIYLSRMRVEKLGTLCRPIRSHNGLSVEENLITIKVGGRSHPHAVEVIAEYPDWLKE